MPYLHTTHFHRGKLPHWEVVSGRYFVTVRLADSLPRHAVLRLWEAHAALAAVEPRSTAYATLQRLYFATMDKYLDAGTGQCVLAQDAAARVVADELRKLADWRVDVPHYTIMPNHWHALIVCPNDSDHSLADILKRLKGRTGSRIRRTVGGAGAVWQKEWFDHWIRNETEWEKTVAYIQNNPVKAGLVSDWRKHAWTR